MLDTIKKYIEEKDLLNLAEEIIEKFDTKKEKEKKLNLKLQKINIQNFGCLEKFELEFDKDINFIEGEIGSGKSTALESLPYLLNAGSRDLKGFIGEYDDKVTGSLLFNNDVEMKLTRTNESVKICLAQGKDKDDIITKKILELDGKLEEIIGISPDLLLSTIYYSPRLSFQFSRKLPFEIKELLIRVAKLDIWLNLEKYTKELKKEEKTKIDEINGVIGYASNIDQSEDELNKLIKNTQKDIDDIDEEIKGLKTYDITKLNKDYNVIKNKIDSREEVEKKIKEHSDLKKEIKDIENKIVDIMESIKKIGYSTEKVDKLNKEIDVLKNELIEVKNTGLNIKDEITKKEKLLKVSACPILQIDCDKLKENSTVVEKDLVEMNTERNVLLKKYNDIDAKIKKQEEELLSLKKDGNKVDEFNTKRKYLEDDLKDKNKNFSAIKIDNLNSELKKYSKSLYDELDTLDLQIKDINKDINTQQKERDGLNDKKLVLLTDIKDYEQKLKDIKNMDKFVKEKNKLEKRQTNYDVLITKFGKNEIPKFEASKILKQLNKNINLVIDVLSKSQITLNINDDFEMSVKLKGKEKEWTPKTVSDAEDHIINLSFVVALGLLVFKNKLPYFFADDVLAYQSEKTGEDIIRGLIKLHKEEYIEQIYIASNRLKDYELNNLADKVIEFECGKYKIKETK
ncbi:MAG: AAA family ATPase [Candidatus Nanoarchaeia archaeon]|nr:AAA family ATPase [Candidatus Nanoarchaeia archaeon]